MPLATRSNHVVFAYDQVIRPHRSYRRSGVLPWLEAWTHHRWIRLQLSVARGVDSGGIRASASASGQQHVLRLWLGVSKGMFPVVYFYSTRSLFMSVKFIGIIRLFTKMLVYLVTHSFGNIAGFKIVVSVCQCKYIF